MRRFIVVSSALATVFIIAPMLAADPLPNGIQASGNDFLDDVIADVVTKQDTYFTANGVYWQGKATHDVIGDTAKDHRTNHKPTDIAETWADLGISPAKGRFSTSVDTYETPDCYGYTISVSTRHGKDLYKKTMDFGCLPNREKGWAYQPPA
tara:strand:- start:9713 stop:10168 length:456 start_codon:yes stop_codon:yes gene_type:complete